MILDMNSIQTKKSAGVAKRGDPTSTDLAYVNKKYGSRSMPSLGPVRRNGVTRRQS